MASAARGAASPRKPQILTHASSSRLPRDARGPRPPAAVRTHATIFDALAELGESRRPARGHAGGLRRTSAATPRQSSCLTCSRSVRRQTVSSCSRGGRRPRCSRTCGRRVLGAAPVLARVDGDRPGLSREGALSAVLGPDTSSRLASRRWTRQGSAGQLVRFELVEKLLGHVLYEGILEFIESVDLLGNLINRHPSSARSASRRSPRGASSCAT